MSSAAFWDLLKKATAVCVLGGFAFAIIQFTWSASEDASSIRTSVRANEETAERVLVKQTKLQERNVQVHESLNEIVRDHEGRLSRLEGRSELSPGG